MASNEAKRIVKGVVDITVGLPVKGAVNVAKDAASVALDAAGAGLGTGRRVAGAAARRLARLAGDGLGAVLDTEAGRRLVDEGVVRLGSGVSMIASIAAEVVYDINQDQIRRRG